MNGRVPAPPAALDVGYDRKPFAAHVTLLRDLRREQAAACATPIEPPIVWKVARPVLLQSWPTPAGVQYRALDAS